MSMGLAFWILMLLWFVFGLWRAWPPATPPQWPWGLAGDLLLFIVIALLGWRVFGPPIHG